MSTSPPVATDDTSASKARRKRKTRRRVTGALVLMMGLLSAGFLASALTPTPQVATADTDSAALIREGKQLYDTSCVTCHGANLQGVQDRGPSLIGVGEAAVYFQVSSGRMPAVRNEAQALRKPPKFDDKQIDALGAYIQANGGGPTVILDENGEVAQESLRGDDIARGSELFRLNCASCHNFTGQGGALSSGKFAPDLGPANEQEIYTAMVTGPQNMPKFSDRQLTIEEKSDIIAYVKSAQETKAAGGWGLGGFGPGTEMIALWVVGIAAVVGATLWIGARS
ncbi:cytochrome C [Rhodococcoides fascians]|uniref:cytochrome bc1 complex diheme cytochrome c subunit n=1 Tax=Nocardiaceae TaxID=85025 RepID=UPI00050C93DC|nr:MULTISPECIES: cytochrome c [Rhodococcus]MBJ7323319.1 c-type cytochrome [Rhodococcus sp. (in: high G+C Gram-positive bacteria)]MBY3793254.1 c-type cytochrome [Rhodococcus fascians]MBY3826011.1 c-type cytochrome [Rhodococcus fascians]MBY3836473.1 c-type cytochrome [Rhodococcus fascians]MBY3866119.1 c-type cytochrome [Rhodococcus fascians]